MKNDQRIKAVDDKIIMDKIIGFRSAVSVEFFEKEFFQRMLPVGVVVSGFSESPGCESCSHGAIKVL